MKKSMWDFLDGVEIWHLTNLAQIYFCNIAWFMKLLFYTIILHLVPAGVMN